MASKNMTARKKSKTYANPQEGRRHGTKREDCMARTVIQVQIVLQDYASRSSFAAGEATAALTLLVRTGRSPEYKRELLKPPLETVPGRDPRT
jgi:hypothetical protein